MVLYGFYMVFIWFYIVWWGLQGMYIRISFELKGVIASWDTCASMEWDIHEISIWMCWMSERWWAISESGETGKMYENGGENWTYMMRKYRFLFLALGFWTWNQYTMIDSGSDKERYMIYVYDCIGICICIYIYIYTYLLVI